MRTGFQNVFLKIPPHFIFETACRESLKVGHILHVSRKAESFVSVAKSEKKLKTRLLVTVTVNNLKHVWSVLKVNVNIKFAKGKQTVKTGIQKVAGLNI